MAGKKVKETQKSKVDTKGKKDEGISCLGMIKSFFDLMFFPFVGVWKLFRSVWIFCEEKFGDKFPFLFFGLIISSKIYYFVKFFMLINLNSIWAMLNDAMAGGGVGLYLTNTVGRIVYNFTAILFDALIIISYAIRTKPTGEGKAAGFSERYYPLITVLFPMISFSYLLYSDLTIGSILMYFNLPPMTPLFVTLVGCIISFAGATLSIIALWSLKRSFSIMAEVRTLVTTGMYKRIRHPLYMSEIIHAFGNCVLFAHPVSLLIFVITLTLEIVRAKIEERKFLKVHPEYAAFKKRTGFLWPKFGAVKHASKLD